MSTSTSYEILSSKTPLTISSVRITIPASNLAQLSEPAIVTPASDPDLYDYAIEGDESPGEDNEDFNNNICGDKEKVGRWSDQEHRVFLDGLNHYGKQWKTIAGMIGTRTVVQVRTHAQKYFQKMERSSGSSDESVTRSPKKVGQRSVHPKRKSLPIVVSSRKKQRKHRQLSMVGTTGDVIAVELEGRDEIAETVDLPPFSSFIFKSSSSTSSENWSTISPDAVANTADLQYHSETTGRPVEGGMESADFDLLEEDPLEWLIETDSSQQYLPESSLPLFPFLHDDRLALLEPEDEPKDDALADKEPQSDLIHDALLQNMVDPNVTMLSLFLPTSEKDDPHVDE